MASILETAKDSREETRINSLNRSGSYWRHLQVYTAGVGFRELWEEILRIFPSKIVFGFEAKCSGPDAKPEYMMFKGRSWSAILEHTGEEAGKEVYEFCFTEFSSTNGLADDTSQMNLCMTVVEKALMLKDPFTRFVTKENTGLKSRPSLF